MYKRQPFYLVEHDDGTFSLCLAFSFLRGKYAGFGQDAFNQYAKQIGEPVKAVSYTHLHVYAIEGNFDDAQTGVKKLFSDEAFAAELKEKGVKLSSANSINIGRLVPQVAYYVYSYVKLVESGELEDGQPVNIVVPTGNFGNILAAYMAGQMGINIGKLICASNENKILTDFLNTGVYDTRRDFHVTNSPSMRCV